MTTTDTVNVPTLMDWHHEDHSHVTPRTIAGYSLRWVKELAPAGPWVTKSRAELSVPLELDMPTLNASFLGFVQKHQKEPDIRGLRLYRVSGIPEGTIGGTEFHRQRQEMVWCVRGKVRWVCQDIFGDAKEYVLENGSGVWMPPFILHTYSAMLPDSELLVLCNTTFDANDPRTHDTWSAEVFQQLQQDVRRSVFWENEKNVPV